MLLDVSPPRLLMLLIQGSLVFDRKDLQLEATYILVQGGTLQIGTGGSLHNKQPPLGPYAARVLGCCLCAGWVMSEWCVCRLAVHTEGLGGRVA